MPPALVAGDEAVLSLREWRPRRPARHFVPGFSPLRARTVTFRFELSVLTRAGWSDWVGTATLGPRMLSPIATSVAGLASDVDLFVAPAPAARVRLRVRLRAGDAAAAGAPALITLSASEIATGTDLAGATAAARATNEASPPGLARSRAARVRPRGRGQPGRRRPPPRAVPPLSQMQAPAGLAARICSPTSVAMVLRAWNVRVAATSLAREMYHPALDLYGLWPTAIYAAARHGVAGYLLRFPDWESAAWCLRAGLPIIASVRYREGELSGAAIAATKGHLLVLVAEDGDDVIVNDPAAPTPATVSRRYRKSELSHIWLDRAGVGYVLFRPGSVRAAR